MQHIIHVMFKGVQGKLQNRLKLKMCIYENMIVIGVMIFCDFFRWYIKVAIKLYFRFMGGAGEACSHVTEGISTGLQVFDNYETIRENR